MTSPAELANQVRAGLEDYGYDDMPHGPAVDRKECHAALSVLEERLEQAEKALGTLYVYTQALEDEAGALMLSHGLSFPAGGEQAGELTRAALARGVVGETSGDKQGQAT